MNILATVAEFMSFVKDNDYKNVTLVTACSNEEFYSNFYSNFPEKMRSMNITSIEFQPGNIKLYVL